MAPPQVSYAPTLEKFLKGLKSTPLEASIEALIYLLKRRQVNGDECATATAHILLQVVAKSKWSDVDELISRVQATGSRLVRARPFEPVIGNIVRRVLGLIRSEANEERNADDLGSEAASDIQSLTIGVPAPSAPPAPAPKPVPAPIRPSMSVSKSMFNLLSIDAVNSPVTGSSTPMSQALPTSTHALRSEVIDGIEEILDEIHQADDQIAGFAEIQINPGDHVLAFQPSRTVEKFLIKAASKRKFNVLIATLDPINPGTEPPYADLRKKLNSAGVKTILLATSGLMAFAPRINKLILSAKAVFQNGGLLVEAGCVMAAMAAHEYMKPVVVLCGVYKFCPEDPSSEITNGGERGDPSKYVTYADGPELADLKVEVFVSEYMPPELVDVYLTNLGPQTRQHLGGILTDHYHTEDMGFSIHLSTV